MGLFDKKSSFSRSELRGAFRKDTGIIPHTGGKKFYEKQRAEIASKSFSRRYGGQISKQDFRGAVRDIGMQKRDVKTFRERREIEKKVGYLKRMGGLK